MSKRLQKIQNWPELARAADWSAAALAKNCKVSLRTLERYFAKEFGRGPQCWLKEERMRQAKELVADGSMVKETAACLGYTHPQHFSRDYKRHFGHSPTQTAQPRL